MPTPRLVLASTSPFRRELLDRLGLAYDTAAPDIDESRLPDETAAALVMRLAEAKARAVAQDFEGALIIGSDQVATLDGDILGKPGTHERAVEQLRRASGRTLVFHTGLCLLRSRDGQARCIEEPFEVKFRGLSDAQIQAYVAREQPLHTGVSFKAE